MYKHIVSLQHVQLVYHGTHVALAKTDRQMDGQRNLYVGFALLATQKQ